MAAGRENELTLPPAQRVLGESGYQARRGASRVGQVESEVKLSPKLRGSEQTMTMNITSQFRIQRLLPSAGAKWSDESKA